MRGHYSLSIGEAALLTGAIMGASFLLNWLLTPLMALVPLPFSMTGRIILVGTVLQTGIVLVAAIWLVRRRPGWELGLHWRKLKDGLWPGFAGGLFLLLLVSVSNLILQRWLPEEAPQPFVRVIEEAINGRQMLWPLFVGAVVVPFGEEILFRGILFTALRDRLGVVIGIVLSGLIFGLLHLDLVRLVPITLGGIGLAWLYVRTQTLYAPVVAHSTWNCIMLLLYWAGTGNSV